MNMSAEFRMPVWRLVIWQSGRRGGTRTADDSIPGETLGDVDVISFHPREALLLWESMRACIVW